MNGGHLAPSLGVVERPWLCLPLLIPAGTSWSGTWGIRPMPTRSSPAGSKSSTPCAPWAASAAFRDRPDPYDHFGVGHSQHLHLGGSRSGHGPGPQGRGPRRGGHYRRRLHDRRSGLQEALIRPAAGPGRLIVVFKRQREMSISKNVGALSLFLSRKLSQRWVKRLQRIWKAGSAPCPTAAISWAMSGAANRLKAFTPGMLFEAFRFNYLGPIDGHNTEHY